MIVTVLLICMIERKCINAHGPYVFNLYDKNKIHKGHMGAYVFYLCTIVIKCIKYTLQRVSVSLAVVV